MNEIIAWSHVNASHDVVAVEPNGREITQTSWPNYYEVCDLDIVHIETEFHIRAILQESIENFSLKSEKSV